MDEGPLELSVRKGQIGNWELGLGIEVSHPLSCPTPAVTPTPNPLSIPFY